METWRCLSVIRWLTFEGWRCRVGVGEGEAGAEGFDEVGDVVVEQDSGEDVFRGVDGHGGFDEALVTLERVVDGDVLEARVEHGGVEEDEAEMAAGLAVIWLGSPVVLPCMKLTAAMTSSTRRPRRVLPTSSARSSVR